MSTILRPAGPQPPEVYWTRRLVVLGALVVLVLVAWWLLGGRGERAAADDEATAAAQEAEAADAEQAPETEGGDAAAAGDEPAEGEPGRTCTAADLALSLSSDARAYPAGVAPVFTIGITNTTTTSCVVDAGEAHRQVLVTSGADRIWASTDCAAADAPERVLLLPAGSTDTSTLTWDRTRSDEACSDGLPEPRPGTYKAVVSLVGATSGDLVLDLG